MFKIITIKSFAMIIIYCLLISQSQVQAKGNSPLPEIVKQQGQSFSMVGQTRLKRFGFHIYDASFWMTGDLDINERVNRRCALSITYARNISAQQLLSSTKKEWQRLGFADKHPIDAWLSSLEKIWPDVSDGDQLIVVTEPGESAVFYNKNRSLGKVDDPHFGNAFLAIWLDDNSRFKKNRKELLGE